MRLLDSIAELLAPTRCAGCELPGSLICARCESELPRIAAAQACPRCGAPFGALVCTECWATEYAFEAALVLGELDAALARAVVLHKDAGERRLGRVLGTLLAERTASDWPAWPDAVTWVPATRAAVARRGFDHAHALAAPIAEAHGVPLLPLLVRRAARDQRALGRTARAENAGGTFTAPGDVPARVLIVDDVFTTGATLDAAASTLLQAGASDVRVAAVARAW